MMEKYIIFINEDKTKVIAKTLLTQDLTRKLKKQGFRKHHIEVNAENENDAINKVNKECNEHLDSLKDFSGGLVICSVCFIIIALVSFFIL
ncbi:hypothetical protein [Tenebrionibacter intestinalis]|nr:hypothetical protein [Tenebrionibacter intestinalis]